MGWDWRQAGPGLLQGRQERPRVNRSGPSTGNARWKLHHHRPLAWGWFWDEPPHFPSSSSVAGRRPTPSYMTSSLRFL
jgi:hypothetical protein